jgi:hypothetical protein
VPRLRTTKRERRGRTRNSNDSHKMQMLPRATTTRRRPHIPMQILPMDMATKGTRHGNKSRYEKREYRGQPRVPDKRTPSRTEGRTSSSSISGSSRPSESMQEYMTSDSESDRSSISSINFTGLDKLIGISDGSNASRPRFKNQEHLAMMQRKASDNSETDSATTGS